MVLGTDLSQIPIPPTPDLSPRRLARAIAPRTLRGRLAATYAAIIVVVMALLGFYLAGVIREFCVDRLAHQLESQARLVSTLVGPMARDATRSAEIDARTRQYGALLGDRITVIAPDGSVVGESSRDQSELGNHGNRPEVIAARRDGVGVATRRSATIGTELLYVAVSRPQDAGVVTRVAVPLAEVNEAVRRVQRDVAIATLIALALVTGVGIVIARRIAVPLEDLSRQAQQVAAGRLDGVVAPAPTRELGELGRTFNTMVRQLRTSRQEIERSRRRLEATLTGLSDGVIIIDEAGVVVRMNASAAKMLGLPIIPDPGQPFMQVARDHELAALVRRTLSLPPTDIHVATIEHSRSRRLIEASARWLISADESLALVILRDVTELRRLEQVRREFVTNVSHELRTPLTSIKALVETLEAGAIDDPAVSANFLHRIVAEVDRLAGLVNELLDLARLESGRLAVVPEVLQPDDLIRRAAERLLPQTEASHLHLALDVDPSLPAVVADRGRVEQVIVNLIHNAIKFTPAGGTITAGAEVEGEFLRVMVSDTGVGIEPEELPRLFERFYKADPSRRSEGTGLGLAIAKHIVLAHGGTIWAESQPQRGATFWFTLPLAPVETRSNGPIGGQSAGQEHLGVHRQAR